MPDLPKQELDDLFREGAGMQTFEYNEAAWDKMEQKLDHDDRNRKIGIWLLLVVGLALAIMAGLYSTRTDQSKADKEVNYANDNYSSQSSSSENNSAQIATIEQELVESRVNETLISETTPVINENKIGLANSKNNIATSNNFSALVVSNSKVNTAKNSSKNNIQTRKSENKIIDQSLELQNSSSVTSTEGMTSLSQKSEVSESESVLLIEIDAIQKNDLMALAIVNDELENNQSKVKVNLAKYEHDDNALSLTNRLSFTVFTAPEWSSIGVGGPRKMGYKFGGKIGFQVSDNFELSSGLSISQKKFNGKGSEFTLTEGWNKDIMPMTMEAKCNIIEIPIDLNYHFKGVGNTGFVAGVGLRSFMLHSEWYGFEYNSAQMQDGLVEEIVTDNTANKNWVGSLELSLGYNKKVSDNLSIQLVPYLQIPITGIGEGKVNLYSGGLQFAVRFDGK